MMTSCRPSQVLMRQLESTHEMRREYEQKIADVEAEIEVVQSEK